MALRNRVTPLSELVDEPSRGLVYGNRGCLHDASGEIRRRFAVRRWIGCRLEFKGWQRGPKMQPGKYTELFFLDEATAFAAGHRPCALCRRADYRRLQEIWADMHPGPAGADAIDDHLHGERLESDGRTQRHHQAALASLPDGAFVLHDGEPWLVRDDQLLRWTAAGYAERVARPPAGTTIVITPPSLIEVLRRGWDPLVPLLHPSARG